MSSNVSSTGIAPTGSAPAGETQATRMSFGRSLAYLLIGVVFGIVLVKGEVVSWYRIQEMFHFQSIHMFGIIGLAVVTGWVSITLLKALKARSVDGVEIAPQGKPFNKIGNPVGGAIFGFGWALTGACPGPLYAILGVGYWRILIAIVSALAGVIVYGYLKPRLPH